MNLSNEIKVMALGLELEQDGGPYICPSCNGGRHKRATFYIKRLDSGLLHHCFRDSCGTRGFVPTLGLSQWRALTKEIDKNSSPHQIFEGDLFPLPEEVKDFFISKYEIGPHRYNFKWTGDRVWMPCLDYYGRELGCTTRFYPASEYEEWGVAKKHKFRQALRPREPKTLTFRNFGHTRPFASWYSKPFPKSLCSVVIVEDQISATKLSEAGIDAVALVGTNLQQSLACEIAKYYSHVRITLDPDATNTAWKLWRKYRLLYDKLEVVPLNQDVKDMTYEQIALLFKKCGTEI